MPRAVICKVCGAIFTRTPRSSRGSYRRRLCPKCYSNEKTARVKALLVDWAGGRCQRCGYHRCLDALAFHHIDPATKLFNFAGGATRSICSLKSEAMKCVLLCANCHLEEHAGIPPRKTATRGVI
jgi:5-methylcytosine-specific restriction endonuclease McrA